MALGDLLFANVGSTRYPLLRVARTDPTKAASITLAAYLARQVFVVGAGDDGKEVPFNLKAVLHVFPRNQDLQYPSASITTATSDQQNNVPIPLEKTRNRYAPDSVLWRTGELVADLQVDFFVGDEPTQEAISAALPALFSPREGASGILLQGPDTYWCLPVRFTLMGDPQRIGDTPEAMFVGERRLLVRVRAELEVVHLRKAGDLLRPVLRTDVTDSRD